MATIGTATLIMGVAGVAGAGISLYGSQESAAAQRSAAAQNTLLTDKQADATLAVSLFQDDLNYRTALSQAAVFNQNAASQQKTARMDENLGAETATRQLQDAGVQNSQMRASYGASGVQGDTGSPLAVAAYAAGNQQLARMDTIYNASVKAMGDDWAGALSHYQATLTRETAPQFLYAEDMAKWTNQAVKAGAQVQQTVANNNATATEIAGISSAVSQVGQLAGSYGNLQYRAQRVPGSAGITQTH